MPKNQSPLPYITPPILWQAILRELQGQVSKVTFDTWLAGSTVLAKASTENVLIVVVRNVYAAQWLTNRLYPVVERTAVAVAGKPVVIGFIPGAIRNNGYDNLTNPLPQSGFQQTTPSVDSYASAKDLSKKPLLIPLLFSLNCEGDSRMNQTTPDRVRIFSHLTKSKFLHVEDTLVIGKARLFAGMYRQGQGMSQHAHHFIDVPDARVVFAAIARAEQGYKYTEYKGSPPSTRELNQRDVDGAISRVLSVAIKGASVYIELKTGPGKLTPTGAITPNGKLEVAVNVSFKLHEARRLAEAVLAYMHAWDVLRMLANQQGVNKPPAYLLVPQARGAITNAVVPASPTPALASASMPGNGRPVTSKAPVAAHQPNQSNPEATPGEGKTAVNTADALQYGDRTLVDAENVTETTTFRQFVADRKEVPASKAALVDFYRQRV